MNQFKKVALRVLSLKNIDIKKNYKMYRKLLNTVNPPLSPLYNVWDRKFMVGDREIPVRVFRPRENGVAKVLLFFHGGGWVLGNIDSYTNICANMAKQTMHTVISVDYRLAPEHPFPAGIEDCYYVAKELFLHADFLNVKPSDLTLIGDSAGGNLAAAVSLMALDRKDFFPKRQILIYPVTYNDHTEQSPYLSASENGTDYILTAERIRDYMDLYVSNEADRSNPYVAPLLAKDLANQPKTLIITAEFDPLRDEGEAYGYKLGEFGNEVVVYRMKDAIHGFLGLPPISEPVVNCYEQINLFLEKAKNENEGEE